jgi:hypothetical protein
MHANCAKSCNKCPDTDWADLKKITDEQFAALKKGQQDILEKIAKLEEEAKKQKEAAKKKEEAKNNDAPPYVLAYWDAGACGPNGDDSNWIFCGQTSGKCKAQVTTSQCACGTARLVKKHEYKREGSCTFIYYAEYKCTDGADPSPPPPVRRRRRYRG